MTELVCGPCQACCKVVPVGLTENESRSGFYEIGADGHLAKKNGACVYLVEKGCSIWGMHPLSCQAFDCRNLRLTAEQRQRMIARGEATREVFEASDARRL